MCYEVTHSAHSPESRKRERESDIPGLWFWTRLSHWHGKQPVKRLQEQQQQQQKYLRKILSVWLRMNKVWANNWAFIVLFVR